MDEFFPGDDPASSHNDDYCRAWEACAAGRHHHYADDRHLRAEGESRGFADDATWILTSSFVIFTMQSGFGLLEAGSCSPGFEVNIMMKNVVDVVFGSLSYYLLGYHISFGGGEDGGGPFSGSFQNTYDYGIYDEVDSGLLYSRYIFQLAFAATSTTIVSGAVAMRLRFSIYCLYSFFAVIFYAFVAHWVFDDAGFLKAGGAHDFAGGAPVHVFGGVNGLIATAILGPRTGRFDGSRPVTDFFPSSPSSQCLGLLALWWGWIGFNCGSSFGITDEKWVVAIRTAVTTINATVGGGIASILYTLWRTKGKLFVPDHIINGILGSLVAITPACACVHTYTAFPVGFVGALVGLGTNTAVCRLAIDDPVGATGVHAASGIWGLVAVGLFADGRLPGDFGVRDGLFYGGGFELLGWQALTILCTVAWAAMWSSGFFYLVGVAISRDWRNPRKGLRVNPEEEELGADVYLHGVFNHQAMDNEGGEICPSSSFEDSQHRLAAVETRDQMGKTNMYLKFEKQHLDSCLEQSATSADIELGNGNCDGSQRDENKGEGGEDFEKGDIDSSESAHTFGVSDPQPGQRLAGRLGQNPQPDETSESNEPRRRKAARHNSMYFGHGGRPTSGLARGGAQAQRNLQIYR